MPRTFALLRLAGLLWLSGLFFSGCDSVPGLEADASLTARDAAHAPSAPDCASCHKYPLSDINHYYHLSLANPPDSQVLERPTTCLDCHFNSTRHFSFSAGGQSRFRPLPTLFAVDTSRGAGVAEEIDSLIRTYARAGKTVPWRTGPLHLNGTVDVTLAPDNVAAPTLPSAAYRPRDFSCSAVSCHKAPAALYRWRTLGFSDCPSKDRNDITCGEIPAPKASP